MASIIYRSPMIYTLVMRGLHGAHFQDRYRAIANEVPEGSSVVELCAGDGYLYLQHLKQKGVRYLGLDCSPHFVAAAHARGVAFRQFDALEDAVPPADIVIMQASLYQFHPQKEMLIDKMLEAARIKVILAEPVRNLATSPNRMLAWLGKALTRTHRSDARHSFRFNAATFESLMKQFSECERLFTEAGGREMIAVLRGRRGVASTLDEESA